MEIYHGLILAERSAGERGKFIDILTEQNTVQEIYVRGAKKNTSAGLSATQLFAYADFSIRRQQKGLYLDSAEPIRIFYRLRESLSRLSLAMYFSELIRLSVRELQTPEENCFVMRLMLNTLHYLENGERAEALLKPIFELRLMTELGMMPDLLMCRSCGVFLPKRLYFSVEEGCFFCTGCGVPETVRDPLLLRAPVLQAMRHILFADYNRLYQFQLGEENLRVLGTCAERFVQYHLGLKPKALTFYQSITDPSAPPNAT